MLEDDTGMELLVCNKIISLDLPVKDVYKKIWSAEHGEVREGAFVEKIAMFALLQRVCSRF